jgi:hypothetical protein
MQPSLALSLLEGRMLRAKTVDVAATELPLETTRRVPVLSVATGEEAAIRSPALDLQEALEEMLTRRQLGAMHPATVLALALGGLGVVAVCSAFWVTAARMLISLI